jgi:hypothetical protein
MSGAGFITARGHGTGVISLEPVLEMTVLFRLIGSLRRQAFDFLRRPGVLLRRER